MKRLLMFLLMVSSSGVLAQGIFFVPATLSASARVRLGQRVSKFLVVELKEADLRSYLINAPEEFKVPWGQGLALEVPMPSGETQVFNMVSSPILIREIALKYPQIRTYSGVSQKQKNLSIRINLTSNGMSAIILGINGDAVIFEKLPNQGSTNLYQSYFRADAVSPKVLPAAGKESRCGTLFPQPTSRQDQKQQPSNRIAVSYSTGDVLRTLRLAIAANGKFTDRKGNGNQITAFNVLTDYVNVLNAIFRSELSVAFLLVTDASFVYTNDATDPYDNTDQDLMLSQNQNNLDMRLGKTGYDVGHILGTASGSGGGLAVQPSVCDPDYKAQGASGVGDGSFAQVFDFQLIAHELGHQFGMSHSFNSKVPVCATRSYDTSVEPGSGATIMSYAFTCSNSNISLGLVGDDDYESWYAPFLNFHFINLEQANAYLATVSCYAPVSTGNHIPVITSLSPGYHIPRSTPFKLTASATDEDVDDILSYSWEGTNISDQPDKALLTAETITDTSKPPFFRSFQPVSSENSDAATRFYPRLQAILDGTNMATGDKLPSIGITTTHVVTVRDNNGGVNSRQISVITENDIGPFLILNDPSGTFLGNSIINVKWSVNGTMDEPVNCKLVDIFLSTDGGNTFPYTLAIAVSNTGSRNVNFPNINASNARIKIAASTSSASENTANIFFDISNQDFQIMTPMPVKLVSFQASSQGNRALINWHTSDEINSRGFDIELSLNGKDFLKVGFVKAVSKQAAVTDYKFSTSVLAPATYYFRLKQIDNDGVYAYSGIRTVQISGENTTSSFYIYPNPANDHVRFYTSQATVTKPVVSIYDQQGRICPIPGLTRVYSHYELDITSLSPGMYILILQDENQLRSAKLFKSGI